MTVAISKKEHSYSAGSVYTAAISCETKDCIQCDFNAFLLQLNNVHSFTLQIFVFNKQDLFTEAYGKKSCRSASFSWPTHFENLWFKPSFRWFEFYLFIVVEF